MQQECQSQIIMTSRRPLPTLHRLTRFALLTVTAWLGACASLPNDAPVVEQLDDQTGLTIARLGKPLELYRENFRKDTLGKFAFLGPFETNQMGRRELYLWLALPLEDIMLRAQLLTDGEIIDAQLVSLQEVLLYEIKVLGKSGDVSELYFFARTGEFLDLN